MPLMAPPPWLEPLRYLLGDWIDESRTGQPGTATSSGETWTVGLDGRILERRGWCDFPATDRRGAFRHEDLLIVYPEGEARARAIFWDNEGHTIHYNDVRPDPAAPGLRLMSEPAADGPQQQLEYAFEGPDRLRAMFALRMPRGIEFVPYLRWTSVRRPPSSGKG